METVQERMERELLHDVLMPPSVSLPIRQQHPADVRQSFMQWVQTQFVGTRYIDIQTLSEPGRP